MGYALAAEAVLITHLLFILTVGLGGLAAVFRPRFAYAHLPAVCWGAYVSLSGRICPLTSIEQRLRSAAGQRGYSGGFVDHYLVAIIYPDGLTRAVQIAIGLAVIAFNTALYALVLYRAVRARRIEST